MKYKNILLSSIVLINMFSLCSCNSSNSNKEVNTRNYQIYYSDSNMSCKIKIPSDFNYEELTIPSYEKRNDKDYKVTNLYISSTEDNYFLSNNRYIKKVNFESEFITYTPYDVFRNSTLVEIDMSKATSLTQIGDHTFAYSNLENITMAPNVEILYKGVFISTNVKNVIFPDSLKEIGINSFFNTKNLETVDFGDSLTIIPGSTFENSSIASVYGENINTIDSYAFKNAPNITNIDFTNIKYVGTEAFYLSGIKEVTLKDCIIKTEAFKESALESVSITNCDNIEYKAFGDCKNLKNVSLNGNIYKIGSNAFKGAKITNIDLPETVTFIGSEAFKDCSSLKDVKLSSSLISISSDAFRNCSSLENVTFPKTLERIYSGAFLGTKLTSVYVPQGVEIMKNAFPTNCQINYF